MSTKMKMIIPLLDKDLTAEDISEKTNFVGAFTSDINRPTLTSHIFLMYKEPLGTKESIMRYEKFKTLKNLYSTKLYYIDKQPYLIYTFPMVNSEIKHIIKGCLPVYYDNVYRIQKFWDLNDDDINKALLVRNQQEYIKNTLDEVLESSIPEKDYAIIKG